MSARLYYTDAYTHQFTATVTEQTSTADAIGVVLAESLFYPTSGGQPHDVGTIGPAKVVDVQVRESDQAVVHWLDHALPIGTYPAALDWPRRFDHMQQHTGQHILSQAFIRLADAGTVGFHLGAAHCTIDIAQSEVDGDVVNQAERLANDIVWENRPITATLYPKAEAATLPLRKRPDVVGDYLRIVEIAEFDLNACGGTHVRATGEVGIIKITRLEKMRGNVRVHFRCGARALADYAAKNRLISQLSAELTCAPDLIPAQLNNLQTDLKETRRQLKTAANALASAEADMLLATAQTVGDVRYVTHTFTQKDVKSLRFLANHLTQHDNMVVLLGASQPAGQLVFSRNKNAPGHLGNLIREVLPQLGGSGGGGPHFAQGGGFSMDSAELDAILQAAQAQLIAN